MRRMSVLLLAALGGGGNVLIGRLIGIGVDTVTGAALEHTPNPVSVILQPIPVRGSLPARRPRETPADISPPGRSGRGV